MRAFKLTLLSVLVLGYTLIAIAAVPKREYNPLEQDSKHEKHYEDGELNKQFDHEAFLGEDEAKTFDQLPPEESKRRLGIIVGRIDEDKDGFVILSELKNWIKYTQRRYINIGRLWKQHNPENNDTITWEAYREAVYGFMSELDKDELELEENGVSYKSMLMRDRRRWGVADQDLDDALTREEFIAFLHPEDHPTMRDVVLTETIEDMDKDKDGKISIDEYIGDMYHSDDNEIEEPEWVVSERESYEKFRDLDGDGFMDREEVRAWIAPKDYDHAESEAKHLILEADQDNDQKLTKEEVLLKYDVFVGSQVTDFGEALARHDEF